MTQKQLVVCVSVKTFTVTISFIDGLVCRLIHNVQDDEVQHIHTEAEKAKLKHFSQKDEQTQWESFQQRSSTLLVSL